MRSSDHEPAGSCHLPGGKGAPFWKKRLFIVSLTTGLLLVLGWFIPLLAPFQHHLLSYLRTIVLPVIAGLVVGGMIEYLVPEEYITKLLARGKKRTIFYAIFIGFLSSACCHGTAAIAIQLYKKGASQSSVVAFLLASPWANLPLTFLIIGFFGLKGLLVVVSALVVATTTGLIFMGLEKLGFVVANVNTKGISEEFSIGEDIKMRLKSFHWSWNRVTDFVKGVARGFINLAQMVLWWILIGVILSSAIGAYVPSGWMESYLGPSFLGLLATLGLATVMEVCSEGTAPLAFEIFKKTGALGNSFVFLMAGVATDYTEIGLVWTNVSRKTAILMPVIAVPQIVALGYLFNLFF